MENKMMFPDKDVPINICCHKVSYRVPKLYNNILRFDESLTFNGFDIINQLLIYYTVIYKSVSIQL